MEAGYLVQNELTPDPFTPVIGLMLGCPEVKRWTEYSSPYRRRAEILAATRRMLGEQGGERVILKSILPHPAQRVRSPANADGRCRDW
jgi:hypothetical protein